MKGTKIKHLLASALLILPLALQVFTGAAAVHAATGDSTDTTDGSTPDTTASTTDTTVELTKLVFPKGSTVTFDNKGARVDDFNGGKAVKGVTFKAYNITDAYAKAVQDAVPQGDGVTKEEQAVKDIQSGAASDGNGDKYGTALSADGVTTDEDGVADFTLPNMDANGKYQTYLIVETQYAEPEANADNTIVQRSTPLVLNMPLNTAKTGDKVYLYPKNYDEQTVSKNLTDPGKPSHNLGDTFGFTVNATVPFDISARDTFDVTDIPDAGLDDVTDSIKVTAADGTEISASAYTVGEIAAEDYAAFNIAQADAGTGFKLQFNKDALKAYAGQQLTITYNAKVTNGAPKVLQNHAGVTFGNNPHITTSKTPVEVGGQKFIKTKQGTGTKLSDAVFVLENKDGQILTTTPNNDNGYTAIDATKLDVQKLSAAVEDLEGDKKLAAVQAELVTQLGDTAKDAVIAISKDDGTFEFTGLAYGDYQAVEIAAPKGYAVATTTTPFTVSKDSYSADPLDITNAPKGLLPSTGGMGIYIVIAAGLALVALGFAFLRRGKHHEEV